ncbi:hypothetical protein OPT61_g10678 [Boeremia exigua]|uniref:Uncharacterized protein n=1 Tax=Boeremia exigua TaxID=749465 RepID=A0ACC2HNI5_9PLEO|nr:hypothetical protein OPT61_g10678 [Boeremia exigua]
MMRGAKKTAVICHMAARPTGSSFSEQKSTQGHREETAASAEKTTKLACNQRGSSWRGLIPAPVPEGFASSTSALELLIHLTKPTAALAHTRTVALWRARDLRSTGAAARLMNEDCRTQRTNTHMQAARK